MFIKIFINLYFYILKYIYKLYLFIIILYYNHLYILQKFKSIPDNKQNAYVAKKIKFYITYLESHVV